MSGGQTGVDRVALDYAIAHGIGHGGWCPLHRSAEDGAINALYGLSETPTSDPTQRTEWNVRDSDATVIFSIARLLKGGSAKTVQFAILYRKPCLHLSFERDSNPAAILSRFISENRIQTLNVAGPRQSEEPGAGEFARRTLEAALGPGPA